MYRDSPSPLHHPVLKEWFLGLIDTARKVPFFLIIALLLGWLLSGFLPFDFSPNGYNSKRVAQVSLAFAFFVAFIVSSSFRRSILNQIKFVHPMARMATLAIFILGTVSALCAEYPGKALQGVSLYLLLVFMTLALAGINKATNEKDWLCLLGILGFGLAIYSLGYVFNYALYLNYQPYTWMYSLYSYSNPRSFNHVQAWLIPLLVLLPIATRHRSRFAQFLAWFPVACLYFFLLVSGSRGLPLALLAAFAFGYVFFSVHFSRYRPFLAKTSQSSVFAQQLKAHFIALVISTALYLILIQLTPFLLGATFEPSNFLFRTMVGGDSKRLQMWQTAWQAAMENPWLGLGAQHFITLDYHSSPHNFVLLWLSEWGLPSGLLIMILLGWGIMAYGKQTLEFQPSFSRANNDTLLTVQFRIALFTSVLTAFTYALISGVMVTPMSQLLLVLVLSFCLKYHSSLPAKHWPMSRLEATTWGIVFLSLSLFFFWQFVQEFWLAPYPISLPSIPNSPGFWRNGNFLNPF